MTTYLLNTNETYRQLQPFTSKEQLNANTKAIREKYADQLTSSALKLLDILASYSCKYFGLSYRSKSKIADELGVTRRTVIRACNQLESLGIIKQYELKRHNGDRRQSSNAIVFIPIVEVENTDVTPDCHTKETLKQTKNLNNTKETENKPNPSDKQHLKDSLPSGWYEHSAPYAVDSKDLYAITGELFKAKSKTSIKIEDYVQEFGLALKQAWFNLKNGRINPKKWYAYLFTAFRKTASLLKRKERTEHLRRHFKQMAGLCIE